MASSHSQQQQERQQRACSGSKQWGSPERTMVWREPGNKQVRKVGVVYYLCRHDGHLEHPHFMEVRSSSSDHVVRLRDFTERLDMVRGKGMASLYSWSSKRSYKNNGFVWHDLTEDDIIHPANNEYVLKGSQIPLLPNQQQRDIKDTTTTTTTITRPFDLKNWSSFDLADQYKPQQRILMPSSSSSTSSSISPPPSTSPDDTNQLGEEASSSPVGVIAGGRMRASSLLMQLISCGITRRPRTSGSAAAAAAAAGGIVITEDRDYYSGSILIDSSNKKAAQAQLLLKRSSSCTLDRRRPVESNSNEQTEEQEKEDARGIIVSSRTNP